MQSTPKKDRLSDKRVILTIDPGHGGDHPGAVNGRLIEKNKTLQLCTAARYSLSQSDPACRVYLTRNTDWNPTFPMRAATARSLNSDLVISVHLNASTKPEACGLWLFHKHGCSVSKTLCEWGATSANMPSYFRYAPTRVFDAYDDPSEKGDEWLEHPQHVIERYPMPTILIEYGFLSNDSDKTYLEGRNCLRDFSDFVGGLVNEFRRLK